VFEHSIPPELIAFDKLTPLGKGAQGMVWKSSINLQGTTQPIALKSLQLSGGDTVTLDREIKSLKKLVHTNIVRFLGVTQNPIDRTGYLVLEYCPLGSMDVILKMFRDDAVVSRETLVTLLNGMK
jgi:serine/threonine protein kinase